MLRHYRVLALILLTMSITPCLAQAQSRGSGGHWDRGQWIGYMPPHMKYAKHSEPSSPAANQEQAQSDTQAETQDKKAEKPLTEVSEPSGEQQAVKQARYVPYTQSPRGKKAHSPSPTRQPRRVASRMMADPTVPTPMGEPMMQPYEMEGDGCVENCGGCGAVGTCCGCEEFECGLTACWRPRWFWGRAEYLGWWTSGMHLPALATSCTTGFPTLDNPTTSVLFGNNHVNSEGRSGGRFAFGMWLDPCATRGFDFTYLNLGTERTTFHADSDTYARLGRPYFDIDTGAPNAHLISYPDTYTGSLGVSVETKFQGAEVLYRRASRRQPCSHVDMIIGWRWLQLKDNLLISESVTSQGRALDLYDRFNTTNNFNGLEIGWHWERPMSSLWTFEMVGKLALGNNHSAVKINGAQSGDAYQGLLALNSNSGKHTRNSFASVAEIGFSFKRRFHCGLEATFGYTFLYWSDVMRAGDQVDLDVDPRQVPGLHVAEHPEVFMNTTDFWAQGLHFGLEYPF